MMKNKIVLPGVIVLLLSIGVAGTFWGSSIAEAASGIWNSCSRGQVNCEYPGQCRDYRDTNKDSICDRSQSAPVQSTAAQAGTAVTSTGTSASSSQAVNIANTAVPAGQIADISSSDNTVTGTSAAGENKSTYYFIPIFLALAVLYSLTWILSLKGKITRVVHRRIWNLVLLFSTLISALLGLFLILRVDFSINVALPFNMLFWHVESGIALGVIAVFHILWHWRYFAKMLKAEPVADKKSVQAQNQPQVQTRTQINER
jgi:hypothetical protein